MAKYTQTEVVFEFNKNDPCEGFEPSQGFQFKFYWTMRENQPFQRLQTFERVLKQ